MGDERAANPEYAEDVDVMILEYLIYSTMKACVDDFTNRRVGQAKTRPSQSVLTQIHILSEFLQLYDARYQPKELHEVVRLWLELLELVVRVSYRHAASSPLFSFTDSAKREGRRSECSALVKRRLYWLSVREGASRVTDEEQRIYKSWSDISTNPSARVRKRLSQPSTTLSSIGPLFFTISARIASFINQGISEQWIELAAQLMLQTGLESCLMPEGVYDGENPLVIAFAWGWIPPRYWDDYKSSDETGIEAAVMINDMFAANQGEELRENQMWEERRLKYLSLFSVSKAKGLPNRDVLEAQLGKIARKYPMHEFERNMLDFSRAIWELYRKPLLVQIEEGKVDGMTEREFEDFKHRIFAPC